MALDDKIIVDYPIFLRSTKLFERKKKIGYRLPERDGAWAVFRFIYENFKELRKVKRKIKEDGLEPTLKDANEYIDYRYDFDPDAARMKPEEKIRVYSYIMMYESIIPIYMIDDSFISFKVRNYYSYIVKCGKA